MEEADSDSSASDSRIAATDPSVDDTYSETQITRTINGIESTPTDNDIAAQALCNATSATSSSQGNISKPPRRNSYIKPRPHRQDLKMSADTRGGKPSNELDELTSAALLRAASFDNTELVQRVIDNYERNGRKWDDCGEDSKPLDVALVIAAEKYNYEMVCALMRAGASLLVNSNATSTSTTTVVDESRQVEKTKEASILHVCARAMPSQAPLQSQAQLDENVQRVWQTLLFYGADLYVRDPLGNTPIHIACQVGNIEAIKAFLKGGTMQDMDPLNNANETPLYCAIKSGCKATQRLLISHGARATIDDISLKYAKNEDLKSARSAIRQSQKGCNLFDLPPVLLLRVLYFLQQPEDLLSIAQVCKPLSMLASDETLWQPMCSPLWDVDTEHITWKAAYLQWLRVAVQLYRQGSIADNVYPRINTPTGCEYVLKFVLLGANGTGKSMWLQRVTNNTFSPTHDITISVEFGTTVVNAGGDVCKLQLWDTTGVTGNLQSKYTSVIAGAQGILIFYDITSRMSFAVAKKLIEETQAITSADIVLVGTKSDLEARRVVSNLEGSELAERCGVQFIETSAKTGTNAAEVATNLAIAALRGRWGAWREEQKPVPQQIPLLEALVANNIRFADRRPALPDQPNNCVCM